MFAIFIVYVMLSYIQPGQIVPALAPYHVTFWVGMAGLAVAIGSPLGRRAELLANLQLWALVAFTAVLAVSLIIAERWLGAPILAIQKFGPCLTIFVLALCSVTSIAQLRVAADGVVVLTMALMLQGTAAYHLGYNTRLFLHDRHAANEDSAPAADDDDEDSDVDMVDDSVGDNADEDERQESSRIQGLGFMQDPNDLALGMIVALGLLGGSWKEPQQLRTALLAAGAGALVYGIYLTRSRGGAVALVVVLWRVAASRIGRVPAFLLLVALGAGLMVLDFGGRSLAVQLDESASERVEAWTEGLEMLKAQPLLGVGYGQFVDYHPLTAHNSLVLCFAETGLLGCFFWVSLFVVTFLELRTLKSLAGDEPCDHAIRRWAEGLQLSLIGFLGAAFFLSRTFVPTLYLIIGLSAALAAIARRSGRSIPLPPLPLLALIVLACELGSIALVYTIVKLQLA
jgi:O-Antigen ligase